MPAKKASAVATKFVFNIDTTVSHEGFSCIARAGVETPIPAFAHVEALRVGGRPVDGEAAMPEQPAPRAKEPTGTVHERLEELMRTMVQRNDVNDFGANGRPKLERLKKALGVTQLHSSDRDPIWDKIKAELKL